MFPTKWTIYQAQLALPDNEVREPTERYAPTNMNMKERMNDGGAWLPSPSLHFPPASKQGRPSKVKKQLWQSSGFFVCLFVFLSRWFGILYPAII